MSKGIFSDPLVNSDAYIKLVCHFIWLILFSRCSNALVCDEAQTKKKKKKKKKKIFILSIPYCTANNIALASNPFTLLNPFTTTNDICNDGIDNDGDGFVDDNCGTQSLKVTKDPSGEVSNYIVNLSRGL